jgi:hypothetical protein
MPVKTMTLTLRFSIFWNCINIRTMMAARQSITTSPSSRLKSWNYPGQLNQVSYFCLSVRLHICPSVRLHIYPFSRLSVFLSICLSVKIGKKIYPNVVSVCLPSSPSTDNSKYDNVQVQLLGWGSETALGTSSDRLKRVPLQVYEMM